MNCVLFANMDQVFSKENKTLKKYWKIGKKYWKSQGILSVRKSGNPGFMEIELSFHISWLLRTVWVSWFGIRQFDIFPYFDDILHICPFFAKQLFSILRYSYSSNINTLNLKLWTHRALTAASRSIGMHCDAALTLENRSHPPPPPFSSVTMLFNGLWRCRSRSVCSYP